MPHSAILEKRTTAVPSSPKFTSALEAVVFGPDKNEHSVNCYKVLLEVNMF